MAIVLDASTALSVVLPDENSTYSDAAAAAGLEEGIVVPALWPYEVQNGLLVALRRKRLNAESLAKALAALRELAPTLLAPEGLGVELRIAQEHAVSGYDAAYLAVATATDSKLATIDQKLRAAATSAGIQLFTAARSRRSSR